MSNVFSKPAWQGAKFLNDVNDTIQGQAINAVPAGIVVSQGEQTIVGDRIVLDDATAFALSDAAVGTLFGGVYMYVQTLSTAVAAPARGTLAFFQASVVGSQTLAAAYVGTSDAQPTTALPAYFLGIFINAITKGNFGWVQVSGIASVLFDSAITATAAAATVSAKVSAAVASTADAGVVLSTTTLAFVIGVAIGTPAASTISSVILTRAVGRW